MTPGIPERALERARARALTARQFGDYADAERFATIGRAASDELLELHEWAFLEVDPSKIYSTRRLGAPITLLKRGLLRLLLQYHNELLAQQTRFNLHLVGAVAGLRERVTRLEQLAAERDERH